MNRALITSALALLLLASWHHDATACSCQLPPAPSIAFAEADLVAVVRVTNVQFITYRDDRDDHDRCLIRHEVTVTRSFKGVTQENIVLESRSCDGASCGVQLLEGEEYVFYTYEQEWEAPYELPNEHPRYMAHLCLRHMALDAAQDDLDSLAVLTVVGQQEREPTCAVMTNASGWIIRCDDTGVDCLSGRKEAHIYDSLGRLIASVVGDVSPAGIEISNAGLPRTPLWAMIGHCRVRLQ